MPQLRLTRLALLVTSLLTLSSCGDPDVVFSDPEPWKPLVPYPGIGAGKLMVTNSADDTVSIFEASTLDPVARIAVGQSAVEVEGPHHVTAHPGAPYYFVGLSMKPPAGTGGGPHGSHGAGNVDGYVLKLRAADNAVLGVLRVDRNPGDLRLTPDGKTLLVSHFDLLRVTEVAARGGTVREMDSRLAVIDAEAFTKRGLFPVCPAAHGIATSPDGKRVYLSCYATDELAVVALDDAAFPVTRIRLGATDTVPPSPPLFGPYAVSVSPADGTLWISGLEGQGVRVVDPTSGTVLPRGINLAPGPMLFGAFNADGSRFYVPQQGQDVIVELDTTTPAATVVRRIPVPAPGCGSPHAVKLFTADSLVVVCEGDRIAPGSLALVDLTAGAVTRTVATGIYPDDIAAVTP